MTDPGRTAALCLLRDHLGAIGSANDAEDHGYGEDAVRMREGSCQAIRKLMAEHPFLLERFPKLQWELDTLHILGFGWSELYNDVDACLKPPVSRRHKP